MQLVLQESVLSIAVKGLAQKTSNAAGSIDSFVKLFVYLGVALSNSSSIMVIKIIPMLWMFVFDFFVIRYSQFWYL